MSIHYTNSVFLLAISSCLRMIGPTLGFLLASYSLELYVEPSKVPSITSDNPRWIGAWWYGKKLSLLVSFIY